MDVTSLKGLTLDSREVKPGYLFAAVPGVKLDGRDYIGAAIDAGASYILAPEGTEFPANDNVVFVTDVNPRRRFAQLAAAFYGKQPEVIAAVTGTNGKTSSVIFAQQLWEMAGVKSVAMGSLGFMGAVEKEFENTNTQEPVQLHGNLKGLAEEGVTHVAMEATSQGLDQCRMHGVDLKVAGFTNLTQDHLDYHGDMDAYLESKLLLFTEILRRDGVAVLNADVPEYEAVKAKCGRVVSYGFQGEDLKILDAKPSAHGMDVTLRVFGEEVRIDFPLAGEFQLMNALCAFGMAGVDCDLDIRFLEKLRPVPGRLQFVGGHPAGAGIYVDYSHKPDALKIALETLRPFARGRLVCLVGCGGDRDRGKRPLMGRIASELADFVIITDDNPRSEVPADIRAEMIAGIEKDNFVEVDDRGRAIHDAIGDLKECDVFLIAGKGHEQGQIFADRVELFDDVAQAQIGIQNLIEEKNV